MFAIAGRPQRERLVVASRRCREAVERERAVARIAECAARAFGKLSVFVARGTREVECRLPVVGEELRVVVRAAEALDPVGGSPVLLRTVGARDLPVGDVTDERMGEG